MQILDKDPMKAVSHMFVVVIDTISEFPDDPDVAIVAPAAAAADCVLRLFFIITENWRKSIKRWNDK